MRGNAWPKDQLLAPYGGITRIRFKGSSDRSDLSANGLPRFRKEHKTHEREVNAQLVNISEPRIRTKKQRTRFRVRCLEAKGLCLLRCRSLWDVRVEDRLPI